MVGYSNGSATDTASNLTGHPKPKPRTPATVPPPPANWLRGVGLFALLAVVAADVSDRHLDGNTWAYLIGIGVLVYGPPLLQSLPDILRAWWRRD